MCFISIYGIITDIKIYVLDSINICDIKGKEMLKIEFENNVYIIARIMISKSVMPKSFANYLWYKYKSSYFNLMKNIKSNDIDKNIILELQQQDFFNDYIKSAKENLDRIKALWDKNKNKINLFLLKIFKKDFNISVTAIIVPPLLNTGTSLKNNFIVWGHENGLKDENYDLVYLVHESLHSYFGKDDVSHAIIENITDTELKKYLSCTEFGYDTHPYLKSIHEKILPFWNLYLGKTKDEIIKENKLNKTTYDANVLYENKSKIENMDIDQFVEFLQQLNLDDLKDY